MRPNVFLIGLITLFIAKAAAQVRPYPISLDLASIKPIKKKEFSGLVIREDQLLLLPQHADTGKNTYKFIYALNVDEAHKAALAQAKRAIPVKEKYRIIGLEDLLINQSIRGYEGFEAMVIVNNDYYFLIETICEDSPPVCGPACYLIKGTQRDDIILLDSKVVPLQRPARVKNAGFEALYYDPVSQRLLIYFEYNGLEKPPMGYGVNLSLSKVDTLQMAPVLFRITDITTDNSGDVYALNFYWGGEYRNYIEKSEANTAAARQMKNVNIPLREDTLFTFMRILKLQDGDWNIAYLATDVKQNWEGIAWYKEGFFIVSDDNGGANGLKTALWYIGEKPR
jgi:hypothetical protein